MKAWHFVGDDKQLGYGHGETVAAGYVYSVEGQIELCKWGMHASIRAIDALRYAPGSFVCRVELSGDIIEGEDKVVAQQREVLWCADATNVLHEFACRVAEKALRDASVEDARCWAAINAKRQWLQGQITDSQLAAARGAAMDAAWTAGVASWLSWAATWAAAWTAAWAAARAEKNALLESMLMELAQ